MTGRVRQLAAVGEAAVLLLAAQVLLRVLPAARATRLLLGEPGVPMLTPSDRVAEARRIGRLVGRVAVRLPSHPVCLPQALAARSMLRRRGIQATLHLGVVGTAPLSAHAWLTLGPIVVQGGENGATRVASFA